MVLLALPMLYVGDLSGQEVGRPQESPVDTVPAAVVPGADTLRAVPPEAVPVRLDSLVSDPGADSVSVIVSALDTIPSPQTIPDRLPFGMTTIPFPWDTGLESVLAAYGSELVRYSWTSARVWLLEKEVELEQSLAARSDTLAWIWLPVDRFPEGFSRRRFLAEAGTGPDSLVSAITEEQRIDILPDVLAQYTDLELELDGSGQMNSRWQSFDPCTINVGQQCNAGAVPTITPEFQVRALARGTISERFHINVDFDQTREFNATNDLNVYYEGKSGEILEFAEVGQVTLPLPRSQYLSRGIPAGNFGFRADARLGPMTLRGVLAEQDGNVLDRDVTLDVGGAGGENSVIQDFEVALDDAGYQSGQFFFLVDPREIEGYPYLDPLALDGTEVPDSLRPASSVKLYRHEVAVGGQQQNVQEGVIQARGVAYRSVLEDDPSVPDSAQFLGFYRPMVEGEDYIVHRSGLWAVIRSRILKDEALAGTYIAVSGDTIGNFDAEEIFRNITNTGSGDLPVLELYRDPETHRPGGVTWDREMHNIYRISSSNDVEWGSVQLVISQGPVQSGPVVREVDGTEYSFLEIFGLDDQPRDDHVDDGRIWRPSSSGEFASTDVITGVYLVFPAQEPFKTPPPLQDNRVPSLEGQPFPLVDTDKNFAIYDDPLDQSRETAFLYRLNLEYRARSAEAQSTFSLGAIGIRRGSERVTLNGRELVAGQDYTIDYDIGQLTLLRPGDLFAGAEDPRLAVRFEQKPLFQVGSKSILGFTGEYELGEHGTIGMVGLFQKEGTVLTRPEIGLEPSAVTLGGAVARFDFPSRALDDFVNSLPGIRTDRASRVQLSAELAGSSPTTNRIGTTWVEDFEVGEGLRLILGTRAWRYGSVPTRTDVTGGFLPATLDLSNQLSTVWQSQWEDQSGNLQGSLLVSQIDPQLNVLNPGTRETVMWLTSTDPPAGGESGWSSMTTVLSQTGIDLTTSEFLQFYASTLDNTDPSLALIVDIGVVSEDALVADSLGLPSGIGQLDQEVDPIVGVWGNQDDTGLWGTGCVSEPNASAWPLGDARANCTNNNGLEDSEDLNRDNFLNTDERYIRFVVPLTQPSEYLNRPTNGEFKFNLYRLPLQFPDLQENTTGNDRQNVKHVRITVASAVNARVLLSRMQFTGSPWLKRAGTGSVLGQIGEVPGTANQVAVGPISTVDARYVSPPGINDQEADRTDELRLSTQTINEQSLQIVFSDIPVGQRVEVYRKYTDSPRDFLPYGQMRAWSLAQGDDWGEGGILRFYIRLGFDPNNFYLYRTTLPDAPDNPERVDWLPEDFINFGRLLALRAEAERLINANGSNLPGDTTFILWDVDVFPDADSTVALVINDRSRAPNLSAIREIALGVENVGTVDAGPGEVWVDDLRLDDAPDDNGVAAVADLRVDMADVLSLQANLNTVNPFFRQLGEKPDFIQNVDWGARATLAFGKFLPGAWGLAMPIGFSHNSDSEDPFFLPQTDVLSAPLGDDLRTGGSSETRWSIALSKPERSNSPLLRATIDGMRFGYTSRSSSNTTTLSEAKGSGWSGTGGWSRQVVDKSFPIVPGFLQSAVDVLPDFISESVVMQNFKELRFRWTPRQLSLGAELNKSTDTRRRFQTSTYQATDAQVTPTVDLQYLLRPSTGFTLQPFPSVVWGFDFRSARDLVNPVLRTSQPAGQEALESQSRDFLGFDVGWELSRDVRTDMSWRPRLASWFDTDFTLATAYRTNRNVSYLQNVDGDTALVRDLSMERDLGFQFDVRPNQFLTAFGIPGSQEATGITGGLRAFWDRLLPVRIDWRKGLTAAYDRRDLAPNLWDQLVLTGFQKMRIMNADTASAAGDNRSWSVDGGYQFPLGLDLDVGYRTSDRTTYTVLNERRITDREWPSLGLRWRDVPIPGFLDEWVRDINVQGGWRTQNTNTSTTTGQNRNAEQTVRSLGLVFILTSGFNLTYDVGNTASERLDATGLSQSSRTSHSVRVSGFLPPPGFLSFVKNDLRVSLDYSFNGNADCRALGGSGTGQVDQTLLDDCTTHTDQTTQNVAFALDTDFTGYSLGVQFSWAGRASQVGQRQTSNQFNFNIFGRFYFRAAEGQTQFNR